MNRDVTNSNCPIIPGIVRDDWESLFDRHPRKCLMKSACGPIWRSLFVFALTCTMFLGATKHAVAQGADGGAFDGAVWRFKMTPKTPGLKPVAGRYRVEGKILYQKVAAQRGKVKVDFTDFRTFGGRDTPPTHIKGTALLSLDRFGHWSGTFIDGEGRHWDFQCERIRE